MEYLWKINYFNIVVIKNKTTLVFRWSGFRFNDLWFMQFGSVNPALPPTTKDK